MTFCPRCGRQAADDVNFCPNCGSPLRSLARGDVYHEVGAGLSKRIGMVLTLLGGGFYLFVGILMAYIYIAALASFAGNPIPPGAAPIVYNDLIAMVPVLLAGILITIGGLYVNSDTSAHRVQGGVIALASAIAGLIPPLVLPFLFPFPSSIAAISVNVAPLALEFVGFILTLVGASLGITYRPPRSGMEL